MPTTPAPIRCPACGAAAAETPVPPGRLPVCPRCRTAMTSTTPTSPGDPGEPDSVDLPSALPDSSPDGSGVGPGASAAGLPQTIFPDSGTALPTEAMEPTTAGGDAGGRAGEVAPGGRQAAPPPQIPGYELLGELGRGGMGVVYKARQAALGRTVAIKMLLGGAAAGDEAFRRFRAEAEAVARLSHPNIVEIHEVGVHAGTPFFSMEFVAGGSLADRMRDRPFTPRQAAALLRTLAGAVQAAHRRNIVHRDLKPANVLLTAEGVPKLTDFGLAKRIDEARDQGRTRTGAVLGTPHYMSPEQAAGKVHEVGPPADVYALGGILYALLTGRPPFRGATALDTLRRVVGEEPVPPRGWTAGSRAIWR